MAIAQTAELIVRIIGQDALSPAVASAESGLGRLSSTSGVAAKSVGLVESAATGMGNALNHAKGFLGSLVSGPLGMIGLGAASFGLAGALKSGIDEASGMALAIEKLTGVTGMSAESASQLIAVFGKFGIQSQQLTQIAGFAEKTIGKLADTMSGKGKDAVSKLTLLDKQYGIQLENSKGQAVDFATELNVVSDYYNSSATAGQKAALAAQLFGRGFATMIPILKLGSAGIAEAKATADALGLTLTADNVVALQGFQGAMRNAGEAVDGLKLQLALDLIPDMTMLANTVTKFTTDHSTDIKAFFHSAIGAAETLGSAIVSVGKTMADWWAKIPGPLQTLLIQALIGNKVIKTVFGINILGTVEGAVANIGKDLLSKVVGGLFGKTIATPVVNVDGAVVNVGGAKLPGGPVGDVAAGAGTGEAIAAGGSAGFLGDVAAALGPLAIAAMVPLVLNAIVNSDPQKTAASALAGRQQTAAARGLNPANVAGLDYNGPKSTALQPGTNITDYGKQAAQSAAMTVNQLSDIKQSMNADIRIGDAQLKVQQQAAAHQASEKTIADIAGSNHNFLTMFRTGSAKALIGLFPAEKNYLSTASDATKGTAQYTRGLKEDIVALQKAEVGATADQKAKLNADILVLQALVKATTAAVYSVGLTPAQLTKLQNTKDQGSSIAPTTTHKQNTVAAQKSKQLGTK